MNVTARERGVFASRWVTRVTCVSELASHFLPAGFRAGVARAGLKSSGADVGVMVSDEPHTVSAARFTKNAVIGAPVALCLDEGSLDALRAVAVCAGNANVALGRAGTEAATRMRDAAARELGLNSHLVGVASTGEIGKPFDGEAVARAAGEAARSASDRGADAFSGSILTTDRWPKRAALEVALSHGYVILSGQAKGAGMIAPGLSAATTLVFLETDAVVSPATIGPVLDRALARSFEGITVDGQMSTSDSVFFLASGASGVHARGGDIDILEDALRSLLLFLALEVVRDGEGAARCARLIVRGAHDAREAAAVARAVADSPLMKTALHGRDPNWGRAISAAGAEIGRSSGHRVRLEPSLWLGDVKLCDRGQAAGPGLAEVDRVSALMGGDELDFTLDLNRGRSSSVIYFSDLGHDYVTLNAEYTT